MPIVVACMFINMEDCTVLLSSTFAKWLINTNFKHALLRCIALRLVLLCCTSVHRAADCCLHAAHVGEAHH